MTDALTAILAFVGGGLGAAIAAWSTMRAASADRNQRSSQAANEHQDRLREEWGRRFSDALAAVTSADATSRATGRALLRELLRSPLATEDDRRMARAVLDAAATGRANPGLLLAPRTDLDDLTVVRDTEEDGQREGPQQ